MKYLNSRRSCGARQAATRTGYASWKTALVRLIEWRMQNPPKRYTGTRAYLQRSDIKADDTLGEEQILSKNSG